MLTIYKASAGSGKTYQLALHYLKMVLGVKESGDGKWKLNPLLTTSIPSQAHRRILAITFTNKATEEMKSRIVASLFGVATAKDEKSHDYIKPLLDTFGCSFEALRDAARKAMMSLLHDFSFFNVSTIDSFFQTILRTFARELGIQGDYNIEINSSEAIRNALNLLLDDLSNYGAKEDARTRRVKNWLMTRANDASGKFNPFKRQSKEYKTLVELVEKIFSEDFKPLQTELYSYFEDTSKLDKFRLELEKIIKVSTQKLYEAGERAVTDVGMSGQESYISSNTRNLLDSLAKGTADPAKPSAMFKRLAEGVRVIGEAEYKLNKVGKVQMEPNDTYIAAIDRLAQAIQKTYPVYRTARLLLNTVPQLEFINVMLKYLEQYKKESNLVILDDTSTYISRIIGGSEIPFIYEHLGNHLRHFLIDEFQDTSRLQWKNIFPLVDNSHSDGDDSLIIGDIKQAIYRFRNSDASILGSDLQNIDFPDPETRQIRGETEEENCNYRTAHGIVKFNNSIMPLFASFALNDPEPDGYVGNQVVQMRSEERADLPAHIALFPYDYKSKNTEYDVTANPLTQPVISDEETKIRVLVEQIKKQRQTHSLNDIAILFRTSENVKNVIKALLDEGIDVQSADSLFLKNAPSVRLLVSLLHMLVSAGLSVEEDHEDDEIALKREEDTARREHRTTTSTERRPAKLDNSALTNQTLFESRYNFFLSQGGPGRTPLSPQEAIQKALDPEAKTEVNAIEYIDTVTVGKEKSDPTPDVIGKAPQSLNETIEMILHKHPATLVAIIEAILSAGLIPDTALQAEKDYIAAFTDLALNYSETNNNDLVGFLDWWVQHQDKVTIIPPPECEAVRVMSIHRAKGLEFECVHLIDFDWPLVDDRENAWLDIRPGHRNPAYKTDVNVSLPIPTEYFPPLVNLSLTEGAIGFPGSPFRNFLDEQQRLMRIDALNLAYVGLTRPVSSLSIYFNVDSAKIGTVPRPEDLKTVGHILAAVLQIKTGKTAGDDELEITSENFNPETLALNIDVPATKELSDDEKVKKADKEAKKKKEKEENAKMSALLNKCYTSKFRSDMSSIVNVESFQRNPEDIVEPDEDGHPAEKTKEERLEMRKKQKQEKTQRGVDLHEILSFIPYVSSDADIYTVINEAIEKASLSEGFVKENIDNYRSVILQMLATPGTEDWFSPDNIIETELTYHFPNPKAGTDKATANTPMALNKRMDRLVQQPDGTVIVVDYKFTQVQDIEHNEQVEQYMSHLSEILPNTEIKGYLWYVDLNLISPISFK